MHRFTVTSLFLFFSFFLFSQETNFDDYKYIVVPNKFQFLKKADEHQTSSLTKFLFEKKGFQVFLSDENFPEDMIQQKCNVLYLDIKDDSDMFTTKSTIELNDCKGKNVYTSQVGKSRIKEFKKAYQESIRNAYNSMTDVKFSYKPSEKNYSFS